MTYMLLNLCTSFEVVRELKSIVEDAGAEITNSKPTLKGKGGVSGDLGGR